MISFTFNPRRLALATAIAALLSQTSVCAKTPFNPLEYPKSRAHCKAVTRSSNETVNLSLRYVDINRRETKTLVMVHGWPGLWSTWSNQIEEFKNGYRLILPDLRGFGSSAHPPDIRSSGTMGDLVGDLVCILRHAGVDTATCIGHDWGSQLCYEAARMRPDTFTAVIGAVVPYIPSAGPFVPVAQLTAAFQRLTYQLYFDNKTDAAIIELDQDIRRTLRATLRSVASPPPDAFLTSPNDFLSAYTNISEIPPIPFLSREEEDYLVHEYSIQGFKYTLEFYTTEDRMGSWQLAQQQGNFSVPQPALAIYPTNDPVADWVLAAELLKSNEFVTSLTTVTLEGAHWVHLEHPDKFNKIVRQWLNGLELLSKADDEL